MGRYVAWGSGEIQMESLLRCSTPGMMDDQSLSEVENLEQVLADACSKGGNG